jgi:hypothetical protein
VPQTPIRFYALAATPAARAVIEQAADFLRNIFAR